MYSFFVVFFQTHILSAEVYQCACLDVLWGRSAKREVPSLNDLSGIAENFA